MARPDHLDVYYGSELVGTIHDTSPVGFEYAPAWLERHERMTVAAIALQPGRHATPAVQAFFENLLPEGELRHYLAEQRKASTLFSLLLEVAGDTAGAFVIVPGGQSPQPATYEATTWEALAAALGKTSASAIDLHGSDARISLAGAQDKTSLAIFDDGIPRFPRGTSPSTHILKPNIKRLAKVWHSAANETITMRAAARCGLPTADVFYEPHTQSCVVRRFDRLARPDGTLARLVQYDLCQLAGTVSEKKYEKEGGPGLAACAELIRRYSTQPAVDLRHFVRLDLLQSLRGQQRQPREEPVDLQLARQRRDADPVLRPDVHAHVPWVVTGIRVRDRRRVQAGSDDQGAAHATGSAARHATTVPCATSGRSRATTTRRIGRGSRGGQAVASPFGEDHGRSHAAVHPFHDTQDRGAIGVVSMDGDTTITVLELGRLGGAARDRGTTGRAAGISMTR